MNRTAAILALCLAGSNGLAQMPMDEQLELKHSKQKTSAQLSKCPDGHFDLKDIPIRYGLFGIQIRPEAKWTVEDQTLAKQVAEKKLILGSDVYFSESPRFQVTCLKCGYSYEVGMVPDEDAHWTKWGSRLSDFTTPFSTPAKTLPFAGAPTASIAVSLHSGRVYHEFITVTLPISERKRVLDELAAWVAAGSFDPRVLSVDQPVNLTAFEQPIEDGRAKFIVEITTDEPHRTISCTFSLFRVIGK